MNGHSVYAILLRLGTSARGLSLHVVGWAACLVLVGYGMIDFEKPLGLKGDHSFLLNFAKSYIQGYGFRFNPSLGFPGIQDNLYFPGFDFSYKVVLWIVARFSQNPFRVVHIFYVVSIMGMFSFSYWALRQLGIRDWIATVAALVYVVSPYLALRAAAHDFLALYYGVPLGGMLALLAGSMPPEMSTGKFLRQPFVLVSIAVAGSSGLYYAFFTALFTLFTTGAVSIARWRLRPLLAGCSIALSVFLIVILVGFGFGLRDVVTGAVQLPKRLPVEQFMYGLQLAESLHVFAEIPWLQGGFEYYKSVLPMLSGANGLFEWPGILLTLVILASPLILLIAGSIPKKDYWNNRVTLVFLSSACIVFGMLFAFRGGLGFLFNVLFTAAIRAPARIIPFLSFFALVIVCVAIGLASTSSRSWMRVGISTALVLALLAAMLPATFSLAVIQQRTLADAGLNARWKSVTTLLRHKDAIHARAVLQLPVMPWPEVGPQRAFDAYEHLLPFILDHRSSATRWSYGLNQSQSLYRQVLAALLPSHPDGLPGRAVELGFDALLIEKRGYDDAELRIMADKVEAAVGFACKLQEDQYRIFFALRTDEQGRPCRAQQIQPQTSIQIEFGAGKSGMGMLIEGWLGPEADYVWGERHATLMIPLPSAGIGHTKTSLILDIYVFKGNPGLSNSVTVFVNGERVGEVVSSRGESPAYRRIVFDVPAKLIESGTTAKITFETSNPMRPSDHGAKGDSRLLGFALRSVSLVR